MVAPSARCVVFRIVAGFGGSGVIVVVDVQVRVQHPSRPTCHTQNLSFSDRGNFSLDAVGSEGDIHEELDAHPCTKSRYTEGKALE